MRMWQTWVHSEGANHYVMIRNHKTSRCLIVFQNKVTADQQARKISSYPFERMVELYKTAIASDILTLTHNDIDFKKKMLRPIEIMKGQGCYGLIIWADGKRLIYKKEVKKKDLVQFLKEMRMLHSDAEIIANAKKLYEEKQIQAQN